MFNKSTSVKEVSNSWRKAEVKSNISVLVMGVLADKAHYNYLTGYFLSTAVQVQESNGDMYLVSFRGRNQPLAKTLKRGDQVLVTGTLLGAASNPYTGQYHKRVMILDRFARNQKPIKGWLEQVEGQAAIAKQLLSSSSISHVSPLESATEQEEREQQEERDTYIPGQE